MSNINTIIDKKEKVIYTDERIWRNVFIFESGRRYCNKCLKAKYMYEIKEGCDEVSNAHDS